MNYRHAYHAGNIGDVLKHLVLVTALDHLAKKTAPYFYLDTHSGRGNYPLGEPEAQRAGEFRNGILLALKGASPPPVVERYLTLIKALGFEGDTLTSYPGSPKLALAVLRPQDRAAFCELEPREADILRYWAHHDARAAVHTRDGYEALTALLPPKEKRGLVLIDPAYEEPDEFERLLETLPLAIARWPNGMFAIWYPIKHGQASARFLSRMQGSGIRKQLVIEVTIEHDDSPGGLNGSGILFINPPWQLDQQLTAGLPWLHQALAVTGRGRWQVDWLVPE
jgi:23S rRNA (adenine2030-N6)-methyltransferase